MNSLEAGFACFNELTVNELIELLRSGAHLLPEDKIKIEIIENYFGGLLYIINTDNYRQSEKTLIIGGNQ